MSALSTEIADVMAEMSDSSLSDLSDTDFTDAPPPSEPTKRTMSSSSPPAPPSKKIKLIYNPQRHYTATFSEINNNLKLGSLRNIAPTPEGMQLISKLEYQELRDNNNVLRQGNVTLATSQRNAVKQSHALGVELKRVKTESLEVKLENQRQKKRIRYLEVLAAQNPKLDGAAIAKDFEAVSNDRTLYWESGIAFAKIENNLKVKNGMMVKKMDGLEVQLAEERAKVRGLEGELLEGQRGRSMGRLVHNEMNDSMEYEETGFEEDWEPQFEMIANPQYRQVQMQRQAQEQQQMRYTQLQQMQMRKPAGALVPGLLDLEYEQAMQKVNDQEMSMKEEFEAKMREDAKAMAMGAGQFDGTQDEEDPIDQLPRHLFRVSNWLPNGEYGLIGTWSSDMERMMRQTAIK